MTRKKLPQKWPFLGHLSVSDFDSLVNSYELKPLINGVVLIEVVSEECVEALFCFLFLKELSDLLFELLLVDLLVDLLGVFILGSEAFLNEK